MENDRRSARRSLPALHRVASRDAPAHRDRRSGDQRPVGRSGGAADVRRGTRADRRVGGVSKFSMDDYVDVAERIRQFYERFPDGSLKCGSAPTVVEVGGRPFVMYHAQAFRHPEDSCPADGWAWEPVPGPTQFTKDSELMNAET